MAVGSTDMKTKVEWYAVSGRTGELKQTSKPPKRGLTSSALTERYLEALVAVNPRLVGAEGCTPLLLHGGQSSPDQIYRDRLGRLIVVEFKKQTAGREDIFQLLGYGHHLPFERCATESDDRHVGLDVVAVTQPELRDLFEQAVQMDKDESVERVIAAIDRKLGPKKTADLGREARLRLELSPEGREQLREREPHHFPPTAPRMVLVAPNFDDEAMQIADELNSRWIDISLVGLEVLSFGREKMFVGRTTACEPRAMTVLHRAMGELWRHDVVQHRYLPEGWEFSSNSARASFSFSGRDHSEATFWIEADEAGERSVHTRVPHGTFDAATTTRLRTELDEVLPPGATKNRSDWSWVFSEPEDERWRTTAVAGATASDQVLGRSRRLL